MLFEKGVLILRLAATINPRKIERSGYFLLDHNGQTRVYRLVLSPPDVRVWRKRDSPMEEDDCALPPASIRVKRFSKLGVLKTPPTGFKVLTYPR